MAAKKYLKLDKYAQDPQAWKAWADHNYAASTYLFDSHRPILIFAAATLGHHALEMYLKAALISEGCTVFEPKKLQYLKSSVKPKPGDCVWGHVLVDLAHQLAKRRSDFGFLCDGDTVIPRMRVGFLLFACESGGGGTAALAPDHFAAFAVSQVVRGVGIRFDLPVATYRWLDVSPATVDFLIEPDGCLAVCHACLAASIRQNGRKAVGTDDIDLK